VEENFISMEQVFAAAIDLGLVIGDSGTVQVPEVVGRMTGLDMRKYDLRQEIDRCGWTLHRKRPR
jgi:hypothetical protein